MCQNKHAPGTSLSEKSTEHATGHPLPIFCACLLVEDRSTNGLLHLRRGYYEIEKRHAPTMTPDHFSNNIYHVILLRIAKFSNLRRLVFTSQAVCGYKQKALHNLQKQSHSLRPVTLDVPESALQPLKTRALLP